MIGPPNSKLTPFFKNIFNFLFFISPYFQICLLENGSYYEKASNSYYLFLLNLCECFYLTSSATRTKTREKRIEKVCPSGQKGSKDTLVSETQK